MPNTVPPLLPIAPRPFPSELISSWLARTACRYDVSLAAMVRHLGGEACLRRIGAPALDYDPPAPLIAAVARALRLSVVEIGAHDLKAIWPRRPWHRFAWAHVGPHPVTGRLYHTQQLAVAWCPLCLRDDRQDRGVMYLRQQWTLATCGYCHRHQVPLQDICPACHASDRARFVTVGCTTLIVCRSCGSALDCMPDGLRNNPMICKEWETASIFEQNFERAIDGWVPDQFVFNNTSARALVVSIDRALQMISRVERNDAASAFPSAVRPCQRFPLTGARPATRRRLLSAAQATLGSAPPSLSRSSANTGAATSGCAAIVNR